VSGFNKPRKFASWNECHIARPFATHDYNVLLFYDDDVQNASEILAQVVSLGTDASSSYRIPVRKDLPRMTVKHGTAVVAKGTPRS
jgi:hypothetical protein